MRNEECEMRQIVLDTETTGLDPKQGHRIIEIGCVEMINRRLTGNTFHVYINPQRLVEQEAIGVHGITNEYLADKPVFSTIAKEFIAKSDHTPFKHLLNTSGIINYTEAQFDMVRSGIGLYGFGNDTKIDSELKPVATLKTIISQIHNIESGESVGYNRAFASDGNRVTATLPLGHADGIGRHYGNGNTFVSINNQKAAIIGNVCMDMIMIDITNIECKEGDEIIIFGENSTAEEFASFSKTISYELLTGISQRVKRRFLHE